MHMETQNIWNIHGNSKKKKIHVGDFTTMI